jgi:hypothetical protein
VNANPTQQTVDVTALQSMRQAIAGPGASFDPLDADPLGGAWTATDLPTSTLLLPAFSQAILINPAAGLVLDGDYDGDGDVDGHDLLMWQRNVGNAAGSLPNDPTGATIGAEQLSAWAGNFGASPGALAVIPEPSAWTLLVAGCVAALQLRRAYSWLGAVHTAAAGSFAVIAN